MAELSYEEELRYNRQIILKAVDFDGQEKLKDSRMLIVGLGGLRQVNILLPLAWVI